MAKEHDALQQRQRQRQRQRKCQQIAEEICRDFARWAPQLSHAPRPGAVLHGGYNNYVQLIEIQTQRWVLRIGNTHTKNLAAHLVEVAIQTDAAASNISPAIVFSDSSKRLSLMHYVQEAHTPEAPLELLAALFQKIHALPARGEFKNSSDVLEYYKKRIPKSTGLASLLKTGESRVAEAKNSIDHDGRFKRTLCHNDLLTRNRMLSHDGRLYALDWEYAGIGDPFFDLAVCASELKAQAREELLTLYLRQRPTPQERQRYAAQILMYRCIEACWFHIHHPQSPQAPFSEAQLADSLHPKASK